MTKSKAPMSCKRCASSSANLRKACEPQSATQEARGKVSMESMMTCRPSLLKSLSRPSSDSVTIRHRKPNPS
eukprot:Skav226676  [mRNA]  locus=scaffold861:371523:379988:- [translate_table: standard]